jgi:hypothetical protein
MGYMPNIYVKSPHTDLDMVHGCKASGNRDMSNIYDRELRALLR